MRRAKWPLAPWQRFSRVMQQTGYGHAFQCLPVGQRRQQAIEATGQHGFPGTRRADQQQVMPPCCGDLQRALGLLLAQNILQIGRVLPVFGGGWGAGHR
ncbi:hypothetical protein D3C79_917410 [compost metagenome]